MTLRVGWTEPEPGIVEVHLRALDAAARRRHLRDAQTAAGPVLFRRRFRKHDLVAIDAHRALLEQLVHHVEAGTYGLHVQTLSRENASVDVLLCERWFDGERLHCAVIARQSFASGDKPGPVPGAEHAARLRAWAAARNEERRRTELRTGRLELRRLADPGRNDDAAAPPTSAAGA